MDVIRTESHSSVVDMTDELSHFAPVYKVLRDAINGGAFPGCAFGVLADGEIVLSDALGHFIYDDDSPVVEPHTTFDVASITKVASTTAVAMLLHQRGQLDLDTPLGELLPGFVVGRDSARACTPGHDSATCWPIIPDCRVMSSSSEPSLVPPNCFAPASNCPIEAEPGARSEYSDPGFILLG